MDELIRNLLEFNQSGFVIFDDTFNILDTGAIEQEISKVLGSPHVGGNLLDVFPELIGNDSYILDVIAGRENKLEMEFINRTVDDSPTPLYLNLLILPYTASGQGLLVINDVSERAILLQKKRQQRYDLLLYRTNADFRRRTMSECIIGDSPPIRKVRELLQKLEQVPTTTILLLGETGVGKNLAARVIHSSTMAASAPFVDINCAALPEHLIESELFGYKKGAFTHAIESRAGLFEEAAGGTLFLDEIGEMSLTMQSKLLTALETKRFRSLGSNRTRELKARIMAATNRDLQTAVNEKQFREDLYYRLNVVSVTLPPLREMGQDVVLIAEQFLKLYNIEFKKQVQGFTDSALQALRRYSWPGNVRELSNCLERAMIFIDTDYIDETDLLLPAQTNSPGQGNLEIPAGGLSLEKTERQMIISALEQTDHNISRAAALLGITRNTLRYRIRKHRIETANTR